MSYLETIAPESMVKGRKNKLKGMALEHFVSSSPVFSNKSHDEDQIHDIVEKANEMGEDVHKVNKNFKLKFQGKELVFRSRDGHWDNYRMLLEKNKLPECKYDILTSVSNNSLNLGYRKCTQCDDHKAYFKCINCGGCITDNVDTIYSIYRQIVENLDDDDLRRSGGEQRISNSNFTEQWEELKRNVDYPRYCFCDNPEKSEKHTKKNCQYCDGTYRKVQINISTNGYELLRESVSKQQLDDILLKHDLISKNNISDQISRKRVDYWAFDGDNIVVNECKNNEKSKIGFSEIIQACFYARALKNSGLSCKSVKVIHNGELRDNIDNYLYRLEENWDLKIDLVDLRQWCKDNSYYPEKIVIGRSVSGKKCSKKGSYKVDVIYSEDFVENPKLMIKVGDS